MLFKPTAQAAVGSSGDAKLIRAGPSLPQQERSPAAVQLPNATPLSWFYSIFPFPPLLL